MDMNVVIYVYLHIDNFKLKEYTVPCELNFLREAQARVP